MAEPTLQQQIEELRSQIVEFGDRSSEEKLSLVAKLKNLLEHMTELNWMPQQVQLHSQLDLLLKD